MYTIQHTVFGKWVAVDWTETLEEAVRSAKGVYEGGWLNVRIICPNGVVHQMYGA